jgi:uncharacterized protein
MTHAELQKILQDQRLDFEGASRGIPRSGDFAHHFETPTTTVIQGVRRCGKSTLLRQLADEAIKRGHTVFYLTLDDPRLSSFQASDFEAVYHLWQSNANFLPRQSILFFDEIQEIKGWEKWINYFAQNKSHKIFITGSNSRLLSSELSTFLTGRHIDVYLTPLSFAEIVEAQALDRFGISSASQVELEKLYELFQVYGGFPRCFIDRTLRYLPSYYSDIIQKDIIVRAKVRNKDAVEELARLLATETSRLFNHSKIARLLKLKDEATIRKYCRHLIQAYLYYELRCFSKSVRSQTRSHPKYYCIDHALAKANGFWKVDDPTRILELIVCEELMRRGESIFYWHSRKGYEVDFILAHGTAPKTAIQVSFAVDDPLTEEREVRALDAAYAELKVEEYIIITRYEKRDIRRPGYMIKVVPVVEFLLLRT